MNEFEINGRRSLAPVQKQACTGVERGYKHLTIKRERWGCFSLILWLFFFFFQEDAFKEELGLTVLWHVNHPLNDDDEKSAIHITRVSVHPS